MTARKLIENDADAFSTMLDLEDFNVPQFLYDLVGSSAPMTVTVGRDDISFNFHFGGKDDPIDMEPDGDADMQEITTLIWSDPDKPDGWPYDDSNYMLVRGYAWPGSDGHYDGTTLEDHGYKVDDPSTYSPAIEAWYHAETETGILNSEGWGKAARRRG